MGWSQIYLNIKFESGPPIKGECEYGGYENQIVLLDFDFDIDSGQDVLQKGGNRIRRATFSPLKLTKRFDSASIPIFTRLAARDKVEWACITVAHAVGNVSGQALRKALEVNVFDARMESVTLNMTSQGNSIILQEDILLKYSKIRVKRYPMKEDSKYSTVASTYESQKVSDLGMN
jgi:type VI protein secretion system component Hcp